jgi:nucleoside-diphosphate-sugar epimerase
MRKKILITGGLGYIGYFVVAKLLKETQHQVLVLDSGVYKDNTLDEFSKYKRLKIIKGDIRNIADIIKGIKNTDVVIALAAIVGDPACALNNSETLSSNFHSTELMISMCNYYKVKRLVFASSCSVYGAGEVLLNEGSKLNPLSLYAKTRVMSEEVIRKNALDKLEWSILRFGTVFGWSKRMRFDLVTNFLTAKAFYDGEITVLGGTQWRPMVHVQDVAEAVVSTALAKKEQVDREVFNVGSNTNNFMIKDLAYAVKKYLPKTKVKIEKIPDSDRRNYRASFDKIETVLGFKAKHTVSQGVKEIIWMLKKEKPDYLDEHYYNVKYLFKHANGKK